jgi:phospholipid transport system substrate-binding protein
LTPFDEGNMKIRITVGLYLAMVLVLHTPLPSEAEGPTELVSEVIEKAIQILNDPKLGENHRGGERLNLLREAVYPVFDFPEMARRSLGLHWRQRTPEEREEFVTIFTKLLEQTYATKIESYDDEKVVYTREAIDQGYAEVGSNIVNKQGEEFSVIYKLRLTDKNWKIYDVSVDNISVVNNYRSQFNRVITKESFPELIGKMEKKVKQFDKTGGKPEF